MYALKDENPVTWKFFEDGNFTVNKSDVPFSAIGVDHGIEHENRAMKVNGGIIGIANKGNDIFMIAPEMSLLLDEFCSI